MSIPVDLDRLAEAAGGYPAAYLLTVSTDGRVKAVSVEPDVRDGVALLQPSRGSGRNLGTNPAATLLFPPPEPRGYTLLVDGTATAGDDAIRFIPGTAVLHRPARYADGPPPPDAVSACGNDCRPV